MADEDNDDIENMDINACRDKLRQLLAEKARRKEMTERLDEKIKALNNELAARREQAEEKKRILAELKQKNRELEEPEEGADKDRTLAVDPDIIRSHVEEFLRSQVPNGASGRGIKKKFEDTELMVNKPPDQQRKEAIVVDTVLVIYVPPNSEQRYKLSYRIDETTTVRQLRNDACAYWNVSEVEYILRSMRNSKLHDDMHLKDAFTYYDNGSLRTLPSKVKLEQKSPQQTTLSESELKAITAKSARPTRAKTQKEDAVEESGGPTDTTADFKENLAKVPGLYKLVMLRDRDFKGHRSKIKLRFFFLFGALLATTGISFNWRKPRTQEHQSLLGTQELMTWFDDTTGTISFGEVATRHQIFMWMESSFANMVFVNTSALRLFNYPHGHVALRQKRVKAIDPEDIWVEDAKRWCNRPGVEDYLGDKELQCTALRVNSETEDVDDKAVLYAAMLNNTNDSPEGRMPADDPLNPGRFLTAAEAAARYNVGDVAGEVQSYDAGGFYAVYDIHHFSREQFIRDLDTLEERGWLDEGSRLVDLALTLYNPGFDRWTTYDFVFEMPASGRVIPTVLSYVFRPNVFELAPGPGEDRALLEWFRGGLHACLITVMYTEIAARKSEKKSGWGSAAKSYFFGLYGILDTYILIQYVWLSLQWGFMLNARNPGLADSMEAAVEKSSETFYDWTSFGYGFETNFLLESVLFTAQCIRFVSLWRLHRPTFVVWQTIQRSLIHFMSYAVVCLPCFFAIAVVARATYGGQVEGFHTYTGSMTSLLNFLNADLPFDSMYVQHRLWTSFLMMWCMLGISLFVVQVFAAILVHYYVKSRIEFGFEPRSYEFTRSEWLDFIFPQAVHRAVRLMKNRYIRWKLKREEEKAEEERQARSRKAEVAG
mmetsp:Transcript_6011/g.14361  ORF Transcript_6011/g.14361 Transcript_6011/m.14361 type:complete len:884 (+) Transcript_6011:127-2778(+)